MIQTDDTVKEPMDEGSDNEFHDVTQHYIEPDAKMYQQEMTTSKSLHVNVSIVTIVNHKHVHKQQ